MSDSHLSDEWDAVDGYITRQAVFHRRDISGVFRFTNRVVDNKFAVIRAALNMTQEVISEQP